MATLTHIVMHICVPYGMLAYLLSITAMLVGEIVSDAKKNKKNTK